MISTESNSSTIASDESTRFDVPSRGDTAASFDEAFKATATRVLGRLRQAIEQVVYSIVPVLANSRSLQVALGVDLNLSWQIYKLLGPIETLGIISYVPAAVSIRKLSAASKKRGATKETLDELNESFKAFEALATECSCNREEIETIVMSYIDSAESAQLGMQHRKSAFKGDVHFVGVSVDTLVLALFFHPGEKPRTTDFVGLRHMLGLRRLRASTDVLVDRWRVNEELGSDAGNGLHGDAFDTNAAEKNGAAVLPQFCSQPLLPLISKSDEVGNVRTLLKHRDIGVGQQVNITTGRVFRGLPLDLTPEGRPVFAGLVEIARPTRLQIVDTFVHRPTWPNLVPHSGVFVHLQQRLASRVQDEGLQISCPESLSYVGSGSDALRVSEAPNYGNLVRYACDRMGWNFEDMDLYRFRIEYPLMDSNILCRLESIASI